MKHELKNAALSFRQHTICSSELLPLDAPERAAPKRVRKVITEYETTSTAAAPAVVMAQPVPVAPASVVTHEHSSSSSASTDSS